MHSTEDVKMQADFFNTQMMWRGFKSNDLKKARRVLSFLSALSEVNWCCWFGHGGMDVAILI